MRRMEGVEADNTVKEDAEETGEDRAAASRRERRITREVIDSGG